MCGRLGYSWDIGVVLPGLVLLLDDKQALSFSYMEVFKVSRRSPVGSAPPFH